MLYGHKKNEKYFNKILQKGNLAHAYVFTGPEGIGKTFFARELVAKILCSAGKSPCKKCPSCQLIESGSHPDLIFLEPETITTGVKKNKKAITINQIRDLQKKLNFFAYQSEKKVALILESEHISNEAANALLKTLEEPPADTILILISSYPESILPTITSRCQNISFDLLTSQQMADFCASLSEFNDLNKSEQELLLLLSIGRPGFLLKFLRQKDLKQDLIFAASQFPKIMSGQKGEVLASLKDIEKDFEKIFWRLFVWLSLSQYELTYLPKKDNSKILTFLPKDKNIIRTISFSRNLLNLFNQIKNTSLNTRLLLENLILQA